MRTRRALRTAVTSTMLAGALVLGSGTAFASTFLSWAGPQNTGPASQVAACGCNNINPDHRAAYRFTYTGQTATTYNERDCAGLSATTFDDDAESLAPFGWSSIFFHC